MLQVFDSVKKLITPELIQQASSFLGEDSSKVTSAVSGMGAGIIQKLFDKGDSPVVESALKLASGANSSIVSGISNIFSGKADTKTQDIGSGLMNSLFGSNLPGFVSSIAEHSGISKESGGKLLSMVAPVIAGFLGNKMTSGGLNISSLISGLQVGNGGIWDKVKGFFS